MKKLYNFRIETNLIKDVDKLEGNRTQNVTKALQNYLFEDTQNKENNYNVNLNDLYESRITDLKDRINEQDHQIHFLQSQVTAFNVIKNPSLKDWFVGLLQPRKKE